MRRLGFDASLPIDRQPKPCACGCPDLVWRAVFEGSYHHACGEHIHVSLELPDNPFTVPGRDWLTDRAFVSWDAHNRR